MKLKPYKINIKTGGTPVAVLHEDTAHKLDVHVGDRLRLKSDRSKITCVLDVTKGNFSKHRIGLFAEAYEALNIEKDDVVEITAADKPNSLLYIKEKLDGKRLSAAQLNEIVRDIVHGDLSDVEMTYFISACYTHNLNDEETTHLTRAIVRNGKHLEFKERIIADKHCIGGVPGNRVTPIVVSIVAAAGVLMPKTSSRAITSPAGTADAVESVCNVTINAHRLMAIAKKVGGFMVWGGGVDLAAADDRMIRIRNPMSLDPEGMLLASIMAKKKSVSANHVLIDIPIGPGVKIKDAAAAFHLKKRFLKIGKMLGMKVRVIITDGSQPIGNGIGPLLEMLDVIKVLKNKEGAQGDDAQGAPGTQGAPSDLREKSLMEAAVIFEMTKKTRRGYGRKMAEEILESGRAWRKFQQIVEAQGKKRMPKIAAFSKVIRAPKTGKITAIENKIIAHIARIAGAPKDKSAGLYLHKKKGDRVKKGEPIYAIFANSKDRLEYAAEFAKNSGYEIS